MFDLVTGFILTSNFFCGIIKTQQKKRELTPLSEADR